jgi:flagellar L-ring protein precursor FlgH
MKAALPALLLALAGCAALQPPAVRPGPSDEPPPWPRSGPRGVSGGVFSADLGMSLTSDSRAFRVGDIVTVILQETTQASKKAGTSFSKESADNINAPTCWARPSARPRSAWARPTASPATPPAPSKTR